MTRQIRTHRLTGLAGLIGALLFFCGDMLFYGHLGPGATFREGVQRVVQDASLTRLFIGGLLGPVAACLCIVGFWHVGQNITPRSPLLGELVFYILAAMMVVGSAVHALWVPRGLATKYEEPLQAYLPDLFAALRRYWEVAYDLAAVPAYIGAVLLLFVVLFGRSVYPRWTALANFGLLSLLEPLATRVPAPLGAVLVGGYTNLSIAVFFLVSVASTWNMTGIYPIDEANGPIPR